MGLSGTDSAEIILLCPWSPAVPPNPAMDVSPLSSIGSCRFFSLQILLVEVGARLPVPVPGTSRVPSLGSEVSWPSDQCMYSSWARMGALLQGDCQLTYIFSYCPYLATFSSQYPDPVQDCKSQMFISLLSCKFKFSFICCRLQTIYRVRGGKRGWPGCCVYRNRPVFSF